MRKTVGVRRNRFVLGENILEIKGKIGRHFTREEIMDEVRN